MEKIGVLIAVAIVSKNVVDIVKMAKEKGNIDWLWPLLSCVVGICLAIALYSSGVCLNIFASFGASDTIVIAIISGAVAGLLGPDLYRIMRLIDEARKKLMSPTSPK